MRPEKMCGARVVRDIPITDGVLGEPSLSLSCGRQSFLKASRIASLLLFVAIMASEVKTGFAETAEPF